MKKNIKSPKQIGNFIIDEAMQIGKGTYGKIYIAYKKDLQYRFACKVISKKPLQQLSIYDSTMMKQTKQQFQRQITFHKKISENKHIVRLEDMSQDQQAYYLFMEYCDSDLAKKLQKQGTIFHYLGRFSQNDATDYIKQLCQGYLQIYHANASHRDLKPQNLLLRKGVLKIADFGFVRQITALTQSVTLSKIKNLKDERGVFRTGTLCGTPQYIPPNVIQLQNNEKIKYDPEKFDMWSIGIIYYLLIYGKRPFLGESNEQLFEQIQKKPLIFPAEPEISEKTKNLIKMLLNKNEQQRIEFRILLKHLNMNQSKRNKQKIQKIEEQNLNEDLKEKYKKTIETKFKFIEFINGVTNLLYNMNTKFSIFKKFFKLPDEIKNQKYFAYKILTRLHQLRKKKNVDLLSTEQFKNKSSKENIHLVNQILNQPQYCERAEKVSRIIQQYDQNFYEQIKYICRNESQQADFQSIQDLLGILYDKLKKMNIEQIYYYDIDIQRCYLSLLRLRQYVQNNLKSKKLLIESIEIKDSNKLFEQIKNSLKV